jgi:hypothetical protein
MSQNRISPKKRKNQKFLFNSKFLFFSIHFVDAKKEMTKIKVKVD